MNTTTEGMLISSHCILHALIAKLVEKKRLSPEDITSAIGDAEEFLAGLTPDLMSSGAREHARVVLQSFGKI
jgi:hypothetical protein